MSSMNAIFWKILPFVTDTLKLNQFYLHLQQLVPDWELISSLIYWDIKWLKDNSTKSSISLCALKLISQQTLWILMNQNSLPSKTPKLKNSKPVEPPYFQDCWEQFLKINPILYLSNYSKLEIVLFWIKNQILVQAILKN